MAHLVANRAEGGGKASAIPKKEAFRTYSSSDKARKTPLLRASVVAIVQQFGAIDRLLA